MAKPRGKAIDSDRRPAISDRPLGMGVCGTGARGRDALKAPFPYFGGKRRVAEMVWDRLGDCDNVIEPFCGSAAFLLARPHPPRIETINDADCMVANFWRSTQRDPEAVAAFADGPVNEADLHARHRWLVLSPEAAEFRRRMRTDPDYSDAKVAGWWCWGLCCWIGGGWCSVGVEWVQVSDLASSQAGVCGVHGTTLDNRKPRIDGGDGQLGHGVHAKGESQERIPGLHQKRQRLTANGQGQGIHANGPSEQMPRMGARFGQADLPGVLNPNGGRPQLADAYDVGRGVNSHGDLGTCAARRAWLVDWFSRLRDRLRLVRVCCGDWSRVCSSDSVTVRLGTTGIFFDPPYSTEAGRDMNLYAVECGKVAHEVRAYCLERGGDPRYRIALCGYAGEGHEVLEAAGWECVPWRAQGGYGNRSAKGKANADRERIWFSPHTVKDDTPKMADLFADA
jgi:hypothetical protein